MNIEEIKSGNSRIAKLIADILSENHDQIVRNGQGDPRQLGQADVSIRLKISTIGSGNHGVSITIPGRNYKVSYTVTPSDPALGDEQDLSEDPGEPEP